jgi:DNA-binding MarR family transcriptional regulator
MHNDLTKSELSILKSLDAAPEKVADFQTIRRQVGLSQRGFRTVVNRLEDANFIGRAGFCELTLTFKAIRTLREEWVA